MFLQTTCKVANQLTLKQGIILNYLDKRKELHEILKPEKEGRILTQKDTTEKKA